MTSSSFVMPARKPNSTNGSMERRVDVVGAGPTVVHRGVGAEHVVVREEVRVSERFDSGAVHLRTAPTSAPISVSGNTTPICIGSVYRASVGL